MKTIITCSYLCAASAFVLWLLLAVEILQGVNSANDEELFILLLAPPPILQWLYVRRMARFIHLKPYKQTSALDDFSLNDMEIDGLVISTGTGWKAVNTINTLLLCLLFLVTTYSIPYLLPAIFETEYDDPAEFGLPVLMITYLLAVPTVIFNLRTFNLQRIVPAEK